MDSIDDPKDERTQARVPVEIPVELGYGDFEDSFEAAALNVSRGGLSMRAPCLPDVGARLMCRFECGPAAITAQGEVVWAQLDDRSSGEFGLCFVDLDPHTELLIEEMIAEQVAHAGPVEDPSEIAAPVAKLELEGSPEPIAARLAHAERGEAVFEQELDLLSVGRAVFARELADGEKRGSISGVELRMMGNVPTLAVTVSFDGQPSFGEFEWDGRSDDAEVHDTEPDMAAPAEGPTEPPAPMSVTTVTEYDGGAVAPDDGSPETGEGWTWSSSSGVVDTRDPAADSDLAAALMSEPAPAPAPPRQVELDLAADQVGELEPTPQATVSPALVEATNLRTHAGAPRSGAEADGVAVTESLAAAESMAESESATESELATESATESEPEPEREPVTYGLRMEDSEPPGPDPFAPPTLADRAGLWLQSARTKLVAASAAALSALGPLAGKAAPQLRGAWVSLRGTLGGAWRRHLTPTLGTARRLVAERLSRRRRRTTASPGSSGKRRAPGLLRTLALGVLGAGAIGLGVYALAPEQADERLELHRDIKTSAGESSEVSELPGPKLPAKQDEAPVPSAKEVPAASPFAVDVREGGKSVAPARASATGRKPSFGAPEVDNGRTFKLRMSAPVRKLEGIPDKGGFTVIIPGSLSLDRAGPISAAHKSVRRSMILNKGTRSELTIRFADGKRPDYRVHAEGQTLHITIGH